VLFVSDDKLNPAISHERLLARGYERIALPCFTNARGALLPIEWDSLPFQPRRVFTVTGVPAGVSRGGHGHRRCSQLLVPVVGEVEVELALGDASCRLTLSAGEPALLVRPGIWFRQTYAGEETVLLVLASDPYTPEDMFDEPGNPGV
jgi:dTDP-4-dehydrorhamnose 3,5-epimerase-like enzyme